MTIRDVHEDDAAALIPLFDELGCPTTAADVARRLDRLAVDNSYEARVCVEDGLIAASPQPISCTPSRTIVPRPN